MTRKTFKYAASKLDSRYQFIIYTASTINNPKNNSLIFFKKDSKELFEKLKNIENSIIILLEGIDGSCLEEKNIVIYDNNPRLKFAILMTEILKENRKCYKSLLKDGYYIGENVKIGKNVIIEPFSKIGNNVEIGDETIIKSGAIIDDNVKIGKRCYIREKSIIGAEDFGIETFNDGSTIRIPHIGGVILGDDVEVGMYSTVCSGTIEPTIVNDYVKIDTLVNVGHNTNIGRGTMITAGTLIGGSTIVGKSCILGMNTTIKNGIKMGDNVITGLGARIIKGVENNQVLTNERADTLENIIKFDRYKQNLLKKL